MFQNTVSLWRRLTGAAPASAAAHSEEERRVSVRHPSKWDTTLQMVNGHEAPPVHARVQDVSRGGIGLIARQRFEPGDMLRVDLADGPERAPETVLACVVHVTELHDGEWLVGCTWSGELTAEELRAFGIPGVKSDASDNRTWQRFPSDVTATYRLVTEEYGGAFPVEVLNISPSGLGLRSREHLQAGQLLTVELCGADGRTTRTVLACVVHVTAHGDSWTLGCNFIRSLSERDMQALA
jgi:hypothetical protein